MEDLKPLLLLEMLEPAEIRNVLVFTRTRLVADRLAEYLESKGVSTGRIHGNRTQPQRTQALRSFRKGRIRVLVATNVAALGSDIRDSSQVVNYEVPEVADDYLRRLGRTGRGVLTFVAPHEELDLSAIERALGHPLPRLVREGFDYDARPEDRPELPHSEDIDRLRGRRERRRDLPGRPAQESGQSRSGTIGSPEPPAKGRPRQRGAHRRGEEVDGNVPGTHELSHLEFLNGGPANTPPSRGASPPKSSDAPKPKRRSGRRRHDGGGPPVEDAKAKSNGQARARRSNGRRARKTFLDDEINPVIPTDYDLPPRQPGCGRRPSHQPAALSPSGRRYLVGRDGDEES